MRALRLVWASTFRFRNEVRADVVSGVRERADVRRVQSILATAERGADIFWESNR